MNKLKKLLWTEKMWLYFIIGVSLLLVYRFGMGRSYKNVTEINIIGFGDTSKTGAVNAIIKQKEEIAKNLEEPLLQKESINSVGQPVVAWILSSWRSGSTFVGDILNSHPSTFYHYEPLHYFGVRQIRDGDTANEAVDALLRLISCNYTNMQHYIEWAAKGTKFCSSKNTRLWQHCQGGKSEFCWQPDFLSNFCSIFPFQAIKTVRLRLNLTKTFMEENNLKIKVVLLVRDPRGTMASRSDVKIKKWCQNKPDCDVSYNLCSDLVQDYYSFKQLTKLFPDKYMAIRYEDFSLDPEEKAAAMLNFVGFTYHDSVKEFLDTHTKSDGGKGKDSKTVPFHWRNTLSEEEVFSIQNECTEAMKLWGYRSLEIGEKLSELEPVINLNNFSI